MTRFLGAVAPLEGARAAIQGIPHDAGSSFRWGASEGPRAIRTMSASIETYSPAAGRDLEGVAVHDAGDLALAGMDHAAVMERIAAATERLARAAGIVVSLGGDHSISIGTARGLRRTYPDLAHVVFDAHLDMRPAYQGSELSHACGTRHMSEGGPTLVLGARSGARDEWKESERRLVSVSPDLSIPPQARAAIRGRPVHLSVDLDVLDPSAAPGVGNPELGGPGFAELRDAVLALANLQVVGLDVTEVCPPLDPAGVSAAAASTLVRDLLAALVGA